MNANLMNENIVMNWKCEGLDYGEEEGGGGSRVLIPLIYSTWNGLEFLNRGR